LFLAPLFHYLFPLTHKHFPIILRPRENLETEIAKLKRYPLKCLEPICENNHPRTPQMMRLGERHNWEFDYPTRADF